MVHCGIIFVELTFGELKIVFTMADRLMCIRPCLDCTSKTAQGILKYLGRNDDHNKTCVAHKTSFVAPSLKSHLDDESQMLVHNFVFGLQSWTSSVSNVTVSTGRFNIFILESSYANWVITNSILEFGSVLTFVLFFFCSMALWWMLAHPTHKSLSTPGMLLSLRRQQ